MRQDGCSYAHKYKAQTMHLDEVEEGVCKLWIDRCEPVILSDTDEITIEVNEYDNNIKNIRNNC